MSRLPLNCTSTNRSASMRMTIAGVVCDQATSRGFPVLPDHTPARSLWHRRNGLRACAVDRRNVARPSCQGTGSWEASGGSAAWGPRRWWRGRRQAFQRQEVHGGVGDGHHRHPASLAEHLVVEASADHHVGAPERPALLVRLPPAARRWGGRIPGVESSRHHERSPRVKTGCGFMGLACPRRAAERS